MRYQSWHSTLRPILLRAAMLAASRGRAVNVTGLFLDHPGLTGKWLGFVREAAPKVRRVALLWDSTTGPWQLAAAKAAAQGLAMDFQILEVRGSADFDRALKEGVSGGLKALIQLSSPLSIVTRSRPPTSR